MRIIRKMVPSEEKLLANLEEAIARGAEAFFAIGDALKQIRDRDLYRSTHKTFEAYCQERWGFVRQRAYQFIACADVRKNLHLSTIVDKLPLPCHESQIREISSIQPEKQHVAWQRALFEAGGDPKEVTATSIKAVASQIAKPPDRIGEVREPAVPKRLFEEESVKPAAPVASQTPAQSKPHPTPDEPRDEAGNVIPNKLQLRTEFAFRASFKEVLDTCRVQTGRVNALAKAGMLLPQEPQKHLDEFRRVMRFAMPYAVCPYCAADDPQCKGCNGRGWVDEGTFDQAPKAKL